MAKIPYQARPNGTNCGSCEYWDDVNGCWNDQDDVRICPIWVSEYEGEEKDE